MSAICALTLRLLLERQNRRLERLDDAGATLTEGDLKKLELTAEAEGLTMAEARNLQRGFRYVI